MRSRGQEELLWLSLPRRNLFNCGAERRGGAPRALPLLPAIFLIPEQRAGCSSWGLYSSVAERQSCKLKVLGSIPSGGFMLADVRMWRSTICGATGGWVGVQAGGLRQYKASAMPYPLGRGAGSRPRRVECTGSLSTSEA